VSHQLATIELGEPRVIHAEGPYRYAARDVADAIAARVGRPVVARVAPRERWTSVLTGAGLSERSAQLVAETFDAHNAGQIDVEPGVGEVRRGSTPLAEALAAERARPPVARLTFSPRAPEDHPQQAA